MKGREEGRREGEERRGKGRRESKEREWKGGGGQGREKKEGKLMGILC